MKIQLTDMMKRILTIAEMPAVKVVRNNVKNDDGKIDFTFEANSAMNCIVDYGGNFEILKIEAEIAKNNRIWNAYGIVSEGEYSYDLDVWIHIYAYNSYYGFYDVGAYLTDIWRIGPQEERDDILSHMYIRKFKEVK